ncbi:MAG: phosphatidylglycerophosphatase A [Candidatus Methylopumilus sp.]|nr:phosphatidylglycerophosphatase A [Candidatus Methylopumilus sp.]
MIILPNLKFLFKSPSYFIALGFGAGLSKRAPGTLGTLVAIPLYLLLSSFTILVQIFIAILFFIGGILVCDQTALALKIKDPGAIVWDEIGAFFLMLVIVQTHFNAIQIIELFLLFRLFDIWKPFPINYLDKHIDGGLGIMLDDYVAALFALFFYGLFQWLML